VVIDDIPHFYLYTESRVIHSLSRITRNTLAVMTAILFVALLRYILNQMVKSECLRPHGVSGHEAVVSNATNSTPTNTCLPSEHLPALASHRGGARRRSA
jgi:hypothetical protein